MDPDVNTNTSNRDTLGRGSTHFAIHVKHSQATSRKDIDQLLENLQAHKTEWVQLSINERLTLLDQVREDLLEVQQDWIQAELNAKKIPERSFGEAEEWVILAQIFRCIRQTQETLRELQAENQNGLSKAKVPGPKGKTILRAFPQTIWDRIIFQGITGDIWLEDGLPSDDPATLQATKYKDPGYQGGVSLVLGAGNASMLPICDSLHKLFTDLKVVALKLNPVNDHLGPLIEIALQSLIQRGFLGLIYGDASVGEYICKHEMVEEIHMTGSDKTYEAIVFGTGPDGRKRFEDRNPINTKPFTGELGNVTPVIVIPGPWNQGDIDEYGNQISTWLVANAGFVCCAPRVIIQHNSWPQRHDLLQSIKDHLAAHPTRPAYYPGAFDIHQDFLDAHPEAILLGDPPEGHLPWTFIPDLDIKNTDDICFKREPFGGITSDLSLEADSIDEYLEKAADYVNQHFWGSLSANIIVHPKSLEDPAVAEALDRAISKLKYGTIAVNLLAFYSSFFMVTPWGAYPGHDIYDIQSGKGKNFNFLMLDNTEKVVIRAPFRRVDPLTVKAKHPYVFAKKLTHFEASPSVTKLIGLMFSAIYN